MGELVSLKRQLMVMGFEIEIRTTTVKIISKSLKTYTSKSASQNTLDTFKTIYKINLLV